MKIRSAVYNNLVLFFDFSSQSFKVSLLKNTSSGKRKSTYARADKHKGTSSTRTNEENTHRPLVFNTLNSWLSSFLLGLFLSSVAYISLMHL